MGEGTLIPYTKIIDERFVTTLIAQLYARVKTYVKLHNSRFKLDVPCGIHYMDVITKSPGIYSLSMLTSFTRQCLHDALL